MSSSMVLSTAKRVLMQLRHDKRTVAMVVVVPLVQMTLVYYLLQKQPLAFDNAGLSLLGIVPFVLMFIITSVAMLRERTSGTLERLLTTPLHKADLLFGYGLAFAVLAALQAGVACALTYGVFHLHTAGSVVLVVVIAVADAVLGMALGLLVSAFARTEFQAVQFMPALVLPQFLLCGLLEPRSQMAGWMQGLSDFLPMSYAVEGLQQIGAHASPTGLMWKDLVIIVGAALLALALASATLRRRTV